MGLFLFKRLASFAPVGVSRLGIALALLSIVVEDLVAIRNLPSLTSSRKIVTQLTLVPFWMEGLGQETEKPD